MSVRNRITDEIRTRIEQHRSTEQQDTPRRLIKIPTERNQKAETEMNQVTPGSYTAIIAEMKGIIAVNAR